MENKLSQQEIKEKYDAFSKYYDLTAVLVEILLKKHRKTLLRNVRGRILEVGIGTGINLKYYPKKCRVTGIDLSEEMLEKAKAKKEKITGEIKLTVGNAEDLPFKSRSFDFVVDTLGLCSYPDPIQALKEMKRVCKKSGKILLLEHGISNRDFIERLQKRREQRHYQKIGCSLIRNPEMLIKSAGLKIIKLERFFFGVFYKIIAQPH